MKKTISILTVFLIIAGLFGCGMKKDMKEEMQDMKMTALEAHKWDFSYGQKGEAGEVFIRSDKNEEHKDVRTAKLGFLVDKGYIKLKDNKDGKEWNIDYKLVSENEESAIYELSYGDEKGTATVTLGREDEKGEDSLVLSLGEYTLWFYD